MRRLLALMLLIALVLILCACGESDSVDKKHEIGDANKSNTEVAENNIKIGKKHTRFQNENKDEVASYFADLGFSRIVLTPAEKGDNRVDADGVISVSISGNDSFSAKDTFPKTAEIIITYYDTRIFEGIIYDLAYSKTLTTKRHHVEYYYLFDTDTQTAYSIVYSDHKTVKAKSGVYEGEIYGNISIIYDDNTEEFFSARYRLIETNEQWEMPKMNNDQWDPVYEECAVGDAIKMLRKSKE